MGTNRKARRRVWWAWAGAGLVACGGGAAAVIPLFEFGFEGTSGAAQIELFPLPPNPTTSSGTFQTVNMNVDAVQVRYDGTWSNCDFKLTVQSGVALQPPAVASYDGRFTGANTIVLTPTSGGAGAPTLTLNRKPGTLSRPFSC